MNLIFFLFPIIFLWFLSYIFIFHSQKTKSNATKLPPGSFGFPIIGESLRFMSANKKGKPESFIIERMIKYSHDVFKTSIAGEKMVVFCGTTGNKLVFSSGSNMMAPWWPGSFKKIMASKGSTLAETNRIRPLVMQFLKPESIKEYISIMDEKMSKYMDEEWITYKVIHASSSIKEMAFSLSCRLFMNIEESSQVAELHTHFAHILPGLLAVPIDFPGTAYNRAIKGTDFIRRQLSPIIQQRRNHLSDNYTDLLSYLVRSTNDDDKMVHNEIIDLVLSVLVASHDTTSSVMTTLIHFLADHPLVYNKVFEEQIEIKKSKEQGELLNWEDARKMKYSNNVINEVMRLAPPALGGYKQAISDITYAGYTIPKGWKVYWTVHTTHKDPKYFENPEVFDPSRFERNLTAPYSFVPFGQGSQMCPGQEFARLEILVFMHNLVTRFRWEKLLDDEKIIYNPIAMFSSGLPVRLLPLQHN